MIFGSCLALSVKEKPAVTDFTESVHLNGTDYRLLEETKACVYVPERGSPAYLVSAGPYAVAVWLGSGYRTGGAWRLWLRATQHPIARMTEAPTVIVGTLSSGGGDASAIGAYLGLPANTEIAVTDMRFGAFDSAAAAKATLDQKGMVRVQVCGSEGPQQMIYLRSSPPEDSQGAAEQPRPGFTGPVSPCASR